MDFGRQLKPVAVTITGGEGIDRDHWKQLICRFLSHQACNIDSHTNSTDVVIRIYPDANND